MGRVALDVVGIDGVKRLDRVLLQTYIIIIGGVDDGILALGITETALQTGREFATLFVDTTQGTIGQFTELMELTVAGTSLAETHLLDISHHAFHLVVAGLESLLQQTLSLIILHPDDTDESQVVAGLCPAILISFRLLISSQGIRLGRINIPIVRRIGKGVQLVHSVPVGL